MRRKLFVIVLLFSGFNLLALCQVTKVDLFSNHIKNPQNIVVNWETLIAFKVNKFISANINTQLIYDDKIKVPVVRDGIPTSIGSLVQFKEILGVGFSYNF